MSATYNWAYRPEVTNKYGFTVPAGADNVRPTGWCYVALFGNDTSGNGSRQYPYRTIGKALSVGGTSCKYVLGSGGYREGWLSTNSNTHIIGDGDVTVDLTLISTFASGTVNTYKINFRGQGSAVMTAFNTAVWTDCTFTSTFITGTGGIGSMFNGALTNSIFINSFYGMNGNGVNNAPEVTSNNTFYRSNVYLLNGGSQVYGFMAKCIFVECNVWFDVLPNWIDFCLFYNCNFRFSGTTPTFPLTFYPSVPTGFSYLNTLSDIQAAISTVFGNSNVFTKCIVADPLFNNTAINDFSLSFSSPAKNLSYKGTYIGAKSIAFPIKASATESTGMFDFSTNVNLIVANDSITLVDTTINAEIKTKMIINANGRQISKFPLYGFNADRNGQYVDSIADLDTAYKNPGDTLTVPTPYLVEGFAITYNGNVYQIGDRITTVSGIMTFTSSGAGTLREISEAPERHTIMARFSDGGSTVTAGTALTVGYWYYVISGSITYHSVAYIAGQSFKAVDTNAFSGSGTVQLALSTESFQHYEPGIQPTSNNTGDTRTGSIIRGNGDPAYIRGGYGVQEFPITAKFIQLYYIINVANLKP